MTAVLLSPAGIAILVFAVALALALYLVLAPGRNRIPRGRRRPFEEVSESPVTQAADAATETIERIMARRSSPNTNSLVQSGLKTRPQDFVFLVIVAALVAGALGLLVGGPVLGLLLAILAPVAAKVWLNYRAGRRRAAFADQLDDSLQLLASNLRAGHSMLHALSSVAREADEPTSEEFSRIINETRVGRDLNRALEETAARMGSDDFTWVIQAIAINREVGGNLAEVLDGVAHTIRERNQVRRQVKSLAAEGKLSAYVLMALPFGIGGFLFMSNPEYITVFFDSVLGYAMLVIGLILLVVGGFWLSKTVSIKF